MTMKLDLRVRPDSLPGRPPKMVRGDDLFGCADCGRWFPTAPALIAHVRECRVAGDE